MQKLICCCMIIACFFGPLLSLPIIDPREVSFRLPDSQMEFGELRSWDDSGVLQNLPAILDSGRDSSTDTDDIVSKEGLSLGTYNIDDSMKQEFFDKHPRISLLSRLQAKDRKQQKKRAGNLSECFWKYCV
ncbi:urotensin-2 [Pseudophryne corroboree]|uniref:urotensin-2 n=1 Tax=Pseudophryne corroboree TaxID=495146 RepID=UPI003081F80A